MIGVSIELHGAKELHVRLRSLHRKAAVKVARSATTAAARVQAKAAKSLAPVAEFGGGSTKKSMSVRVKQYASKGVFFGVVGPGKEAKYQVSRQMPSGKQILKTAVPSRYIHLITYGHRIVLGGTLSHRESKAGFNRFGVQRRTTRLSAEQKRKGSAARTGSGRVVGFVPPNAFLRHASQQSSNRAVQVFTSNMTAGIERAWSKTA